MQKKKRCSVMPMLSSFSVVSMQNSDILIIHIAFLNSLYHVKRKLFHFMYVC